MPMQDADASKFPKTVHDVESRGLEAEERGEPAPQGGAPAPEEPRADSADEASAPKWLRETATTVISGAILVVAVAMLVGTFLSAGAEDPIFQWRKDIMLYALALLGTVTGYYLGRVPADLQLQRARKDASAVRREMEATRRDLVETSAAASAELRQADVGRIDAELRARRAATALRSARDVRACTSLGATSADRPSEASLSPAGRVRTMLDQTLREMES